MQGKHILLLDLNYVKFNFDCKFLKPFQGNYSSTPSLSMHAFLLYLLDVLINLFPIFELLVYFYLYIYFSFF